MINSPWRRPTGSAVHGRDETPRASAADGIQSEHPDTTCLGLPYICRSVGVVLGVNVGIYGIHGVCGCLEDDV